MTTPCVGPPDSNWIQGQFIDNTTQDCTPDQKPVRKGALFTYVRNEQVYTCNSDPDGQAHTVSYAMNSNLDNRGLPAIQAPSNCVLLVDQQNDRNFRLDDGYFSAPTQDVPPGGTPVFSRKCSERPGLCVPISRPCAIMGEGTSCLRMDTANGTDRPA